ncbi:MAG: hypothetical protein IAE64_08905 [Flavobacteriales bacterium]|nr:hypothetical protein [Flavobacteriales bacterium]MBW7853177.1 hypothetical protein [Candidatus Kapabacteria bacterium]MCC6331334.1 hypothetical protein [Ignavibacteria bacterium]NOG67048.1 hypothetical protein [Chlorobiota bacterium]MBZ0194431.1 hypothetical protein [Candidatus Kapabacteria bacterium]
MMSNCIGFRLAVFIPLCTVILAACGGGNSQVQDAADLTPVAGEWVVVHELSDPEGLNPIVTNDASGQAIAIQVYEPLLEQNFTTLELQPVLAAEMPKISDDHLQYTFRLRDDITFSDGHPVTVDDVIFTLKIIKNPLVIDAAPNRNYYMDVADVVKHDKRSLTVVMAKPYFLADMQLGMLLVQPKHIQDPNNLTDRYSIAETNNLESAGINSAMKAAAEWYNKPEIKLEPRLNIGSGPYVYAERNPGESVILARNDRWWRTGKDPQKPAYPDKIIYKVVNDRNTAVVALKNQELDFMEYVPPAKFQDEVDTNSMPYLVKHPYKTNAYLYIGWNARRPVFNDKRTRTALGHLVDRDALIKQVARGLAEPQNSVLYPSSKEYDHDLPSISYSPEKAKELLAQAGWTDSNSDGVLDRMVDGKRVNFEFTFLLNTGNETREQIMLLQIDEFRKVGIKASIKKLDWTVWLDNVRLHNFDAVVGSWVNDPMPSDPYQLWHSSQIENKGSNYCSFSNARADELMELNRTEFDPEKRRQYMLEFQKIVYDEQPYTMLWNVLYPAVYNKRLHNVQFSYVRPGFNPGQWWVPTSQWRLAPAP